VVGVEDQDNEIIGDDFFDDSRSKFSKCLLRKSSQIQYENVPFPNLPKDKVVGLVTIRPKNKPSYFKKGIHTITANSTFIRRGSNTTPTLEPIEKTTATRRPLLILRIAQK
jgi:predicted HTH transcriptional regulator